MQASLAPWLCFGLHVAGLLLLASALRGGTVAEPDTGARVAYVARHALLWRFGWIVWMLSAVSLVAFYHWWYRRAARNRLGGAGVLLALAGMACDLSGEFLYITSLVQAARTDSQEATEMFLAIEHTATLWTAGAANASYTFGGILLTLGTPGLPRIPRTLLWVAWVAGILLSGAAVTGSVAVSVVATVILFPAFLAFVLWAARAWR